MSDLNNRDFLRRIARETFFLSNLGHYEVDGKRIAMPSYQALPFQTVKLYSPQALLALKERSSKVPLPVAEPCSIEVKQADSFAAARLLHHPLVMNFASAHSPGGGFLNGARAQEETLCRCSTLYVALASPTATAMYDYNFHDTALCYSHYMSVAPSVCVFRDERYHFLLEPYVVSVGTVPAPNRNGRARTLPEAELTSVLKERLRYFFLMAHQEGYRELVLGAWGCGAFGHDPFTMAEHFRTVLLDEGYAKLFTHIVFAIKDNGINIVAFQRTFY